MSIHISIIIPVYNAEKFIDRCIASCYRQDISTDNYEIIVVDDGSEDGSREKLNRWCESSPNMRLVLKPNGGLSSARNAGWACCRGEYVLFLDADDYLSDNVFGYLCALISSHQPDAIVYGSADDDCGDEEVGSHNLQRRPPFTMEGIMSGKTFMSRYIYDGATYALWNRSCWNKYGFRFKDGIYHEDSELIPRIYYAASRIFVTNSIVYNVYANPDSITRKKNYNRAFDYLTAVAAAHHEQVELCSLEDRRIFHYRVALYVNQALNVCYGAPEEVLQKLNDTLSANLHLLPHLRKSGVLKYEIEYWLFKLFPRRYTDVFSFLKKYSL